MLFPGSFCVASPVEICGINSRVSLLPWAKASPEGTLDMEEQQNEARGPQLLVRDYLLFPLNLAIVTLGRKTVGSPENQILMRKENIRL